MTHSGNGLLANFNKHKPHFYNKSAFDTKFLKKFLRKLIVGFKKHKVMKQDLNGEELSIGDRILICTEKDYGWLGYAKIIGESNLTWRIEIEDTNTYNRKRNFEKNPKRILKV